MNYETERALERFKLLGVYLCTYFRNKLILGTLKLFTDGSEMGVLSCATALKGSAFTHPSHRHSRLVCALTSLGALDKY